MFSSLSEVKTVFRLLPNLSTFTQYLTDCTDSDHFPDCLLIVFMFFFVFIALAVLMSCIRRSWVLPAFSMHVKLRMMAYHVSSCTENYINLCDDFHLLYIGPTFPSKFTMDADSERLSFETEFNVYRFTYGLSS